MSNDIKIEKQIVDLYEPKTISERLENELGSVDNSNSVSAVMIQGPGPVVGLPKADLGNYMQRLTSMYTWNISTTDVYGANIYNVNPWSQFLSNPSIVEKVANFSLLRGTLELEFVVNVPPGCYGSYLICAVPWGSRTSTLSRFIATVPFQANFQLPSVLLDLSNSNSAKLSLPWISWDDYNTIESLSDTTQQPWSLRLVCVQPIATGNGSTTPSGVIRVFAKMSEDSELIIPTKQGGAQDAATAMLGDKPSNIANTISSVAGVAATVPFLAPFAAPIAAGAAAIGGILDWFGFTRTTDQQTPTVIVNRPWSNVANFDCADTSEIAALSNTNTISYGPNIGNPLEIDETSCDYIASRWTYVGRFEWTQLDPIGEEIGYLPVTPFISSTSMQTGGAMFTASGFIGFPFKYWRGDMEYRLVIPASSFHRGVIQIYWTPNNIVSVEDPTNITFNHIIDITTGRIVDLSVGYAAPEAALPVIPHLTNPTIFSLAGANGRLTFRVISPLVCNITTANTYIHVLARAKPGMQYSVPRTTFRPLLDTGGLGDLTDFQTGFVLQGGNLADTSVQVTSLVLVPSSKHYPLKDVCFGEEFRSVRALMQKFSYDPYFSRLYATSATKNNVITNHIKIAPVSDQQLDYNTAAASGPVFTWSGYYTGIFTGLACSTRYKVVNCSYQDSVVAGANAYDTDYPRSSVIASEMLCTTNPLAFIKGGDSYEITVPYYFNHKYVNTSVYSSAADVLTGVNEGRVDLVNIQRPYTDTEVQGLSVAVFSAYGPDIRPMMFRCTRRILYSTAGSTATTFANVPAPGGGALLGDKVDHQISM